MFIMQSLDPGVKKQMDAQLEASPRRCPPPELRTQRSSDVQLAPGVALLTVRLVSSQRDMSAIALGAFI